jgi:hypothetical protein
VRTCGKDLVAPGGANRAQTAIDPATEQRVRGEVLPQVWRRSVRAPAQHRADEADITSADRRPQRMKVRSDAERVQQRTALIEELKSPSLTESRRKAAQQHLDTLNQLAEFDAKRAQELRDPAQRKMQQAAERHVAEYWVRAWKLNQALYREFGGRIIFTGRLGTDRPLQLLGRCGGR